ncbi:MAG TPA: hypothetical protein VK663_08820 [Burkholderiales bacterium]|nr:hypothetical protein [Burkholderiales bacterium]
MIYMVDHIFANPQSEPAWHEWYAGYLHKLMSVPGFGSAQRFKAIGETPSRFLAMYSVQSAAVYDSQGYKSIGGGGSQSARFHGDYQLWTRNLFEGADDVPVVNEGQCVYALDSDSPDRTLGLQHTPLWLKSVGLHQTTRYRAIIVLDAKTVDAAKAAMGGEGHFYAAYTPRLGRQ